MRQNRQCKFYSARKIVKLSVVVTLKNKNCIGRQEYFQVEWKSKNG